MKKPKKVKPPTQAERLAHPCPQCDALPGRPCTNYTGKACGMHRDRGRPDLAAKALQRKADSVNKKARDSYGPMFAHLAAEEVQPVTAQDIADGRRRAAAFGPDSHVGALLTSQANIGLEWLRVHAIRRALPDLIGDRWARPVWEFLERVYEGKPDYILSVAADMLTTTQEKRLAVELRYDPARINRHNSDGRYLVTTEQWPPPDYVPPLTRQTFAERFPAVDHRNGLKDAPETPEAEALFARTIGGLTRGAHERR